MAFYLVTGGAGFIGSHMVEALRARGERVRVADSLVTGKRENLAHLEKIMKATRRVKGITDVARRERITTGE